MQMIAPPKISPQTIAAFFASMRLWLLVVVAAFVPLTSDRTPHGRAMRAWLDVEVRAATVDVRRMLLVMAVSRMAPRRVRVQARGGARPGTYAPGFRPAPRSRNWFQLTTRALKGRGGFANRLAMLRDLVARPEHWTARVAVRLARIGRSRTGARFVCVAPPALVMHCAAPAPDAACADTS